MPAAMRTLEDDGAGRPRITEQDLPGGFAVRGQRVVVVDGLDDQSVLVGDGGPRPALTDGSVAEAAPKAGEWERAMVVWRRPWPGEAVELAMVRLLESVYEVRDATHAAS